MLTPADLVEIRKIMVATHLVTSGAFNEELTKIDEATKRLSDAHKIVDSLASAEKALQQANRTEYNAKVKAQKQEEELLQRESALEELHAKFLADRSAFDLLCAAQESTLKKAVAEQQALSDSLAKDKAALASELQRSAKITDELNARNFSLTARETALNEKLNRMKALAA